jgi:ppGpp synthetase/RelA/SpoT-type nucleotidyltranferase
VSPPISRNQLKKLTQRLRDGTETPEDLHALADVRLYYRQVLERAHADVARVCAETQHAEPMAPRVKTLKTTMEKLHRQPDLHSLAQIRDLAGLRVVVHGTRTDQDEVAALISAEFSDDSRPPKLIDRRADPRSGYRAVHLEVRREEILIEVQVRTNLQHRWAELFERAADRLGRGLRYGEPQHLTPDARRFVGALGVTAERIDAVESMIALTEPDVPDLVREMRTDIERFLEIYAEYLERLP